MAKLQEPEPLAPEAALHKAVSFRPLGPEQVNTATFTTVSRAATECRTLEFAYRKPGSRTHEKRRVHPYHLTFAKPLLRRFQSSAELPPRSSEKVSLRISPCGTAHR
jgi:hypothetical protein